MNITIDINCDLGEGLGNDSGLMPILSSCNVACGGHAGDAATMVAVADLAKKHHVKIGAHPSFPDKENFGRTILDISSEDLKRSLINQITDFKAILDERQLKMHHVKPHGALYNLVVTEKQTATLVVDVLKTIDENLILYAPYGSVISEIAHKNGLHLMYEAFADRRYNENLTLVSRAEKQALIEDAEVMFQHVFKMISEGKVTTVHGVEVALKADTFCVHSDGKNAVENLRYLTHKLKAHHIDVL